MVWRDVAAALATRHEVFVWDMLGYGQSAMGAEQDVSLGAQQEIFAALLEHWGLHEPAVVAHDFGGAVALRTTLLSGKRYARLALLDAVALGQWGTGFFRLARENERAFTALPGYLHEAMVRGHINTASHRGLANTVAGELADPWLGERGQAAYYRQIAQNHQGFTDDVAPRYGELDLPILVGWGDQDTWLAPGVGRKLAESIPGAELRWFTDAGHLVQLDAPGQVIAALTEFL